MSLNNIDTKYLIEGIIDGIDQVEVRKKHAGENRLLKIYISGGGDEFDFSEITEEDINSGYISPGPNKNSYYSIQPDEWQIQYITESISNVKKYINLDIEIVKDKKDAQFSIGIHPRPDQNWFSFQKYNKNPKGENWISISYNAGFFGPLARETNLDLIVHTDESKKVQKFTFIHELGHLLGLEHPFEESDGDAILPYYPSDFSYQFDASFPYENTIMGWNGTYVVNTKYEDLWYLDVDLKALKEIWGESVVKDYSGNSSDYKFYNLGNNQYGAKHKDASSIDPLTGITQLKFDDQYLNVLTHIKGTFDQVTGLNTPSGEMFRLYNAAFKRFPDPNGLKYWIDVYSSGVNTNKVVAASFVLSDEFKRRYGENVSNGQFITNMYKNVFDREPDQGGYDYWVGSLDRGEQPRSDVLLNFSISNENNILFTEMTGLS